MLIHVLNCSKESSITILAVCVFQVKNINISEGRVGQKLLMSSVRLYPMYPCSLLLHII